MQKTMTTLGILWLCLSAAVGQTDKTVAPQDALPKDVLKERYLGAWKGQGQMMGRDSQVQMKWETVLDGRFVRVQFRTEWQTPDGKPQAFEGHAYYQQQKDGKYRATWFDAQGATLNIDAEFDGQALTSLWGPGAEKRGKTIYRLVSAEQIEVIDSARSKEGEWREFSRATFKRQ